MDKIILDMQFLSLAAKISNIFTYKIDRIDFIMIIPRLFEFLKSVQLTLMDYHHVLLTYIFINGFINIHDISDLYIERNLTYNLCNPRTIVETSSINN